jgi:hypothetical protein
MGIYSNTRYDNLGDYNVDVAANESYNCVTGCAMALIEGYQNDFALFESAIHSDMAEIAAVNEGVEVINEGAKEIWNKLKEIFSKLLAKIKGIFKAFIAKISGVFADSANLYKKYSPVISKNSNWKNFKAKVRPFKGDGSNIVEKIGTVGEYKFKSNYVMGGIANVTGIGDYNKLTDKDNDIDQDDLCTAVCKASLNNELANNISKLDDINKEFTDLLFDDEETKDEWTTGDILHSYIGGLLKDATKNEHKIKKCNVNMETTIERIIKQINKEAENVAKALSNVNLQNGKTPNSYTLGSVNVTDADSAGKTRGSAKKNDTINNRTVDCHKKDSLEKLERLAGFWQRYANMEQAVINKLTAARLGAYKFAITQARRVFSSAAAYASVDHKNESYDYYTAIGEAVEYDTLSDLQAVC